LKDELQVIICHFKRRSQPLAGIREAGNSKIQEQDA
jgi:hypothetical protein